MALSTAYRFDLAFMALEREFHVLVEKPVAMDVGQIKRLMEAQGTCVVSFGFIVAAAQSQHTVHAAELRASVAKRDITPPIGGMLYG